MVRGLLAVFWNIHISAVNFTILKNQYFNSVYFNFLKFEKIWKKAFNSINIQRKYINRGFLEKRFSQKVENEG
jgi:hypothetical protein